ncbi:uncharacterized protein LOC132197556 [Neocloeon triangulifer]|uniref:uncharacterized protein LOC132197556 n=1 Tax=Neocloeon triangulifer TaxID=2078957 RepID=UPI00286EC6DC|nr:uncharacterized protein LOC132197556 [Neocloeon triangulifer]
MADSDLNEDVESLQLEEEIVLASCSTRRLRKRPILVNALDDKATVKRKRFVENKKDLSEKELTKLYLNENFRVPKQNLLETVYEETNEEDTPAETKTAEKKKRAISFPLFTTKAKKQQRKKMVKRLEVSSPTYLMNRKLKTKVSKTKLEAVLKDVELPPELEDDVDMKSVDKDSEKQSSEAKD